jgi:hypothetical protein
MSDIIYFNPLMLEVRYHLFQSSNVAGQISFKCYRLDIIYFDPLVLQVRYHLVRPSNITGKIAFISRQALG